MAKKNSNKPISANTPGKNSGTEKELETAFDGKQREVKLLSKGKKFTVQKLELNFPYSEDFATEKLARIAFDLQVADTQN